MRLRVGFDIGFECAAPTPAVLMVSLHPDEQSRRLTPERLKVSRRVAISEYRDGFGNRCHRAVLPPGETRFSSDFLVSAPDDPEPLPIGQPQQDIADLPDPVLQYLLPSRYCETERLMDFAWAQFGGLPPGWARVEAVLNHVHDRLRFSYADARPDRTAHDAWAEGVGVCRDYAHLTVALCRCLNIPARYVTGWLGDIRWPAAPYPMDFSGWSQVWLGGRWWDVDARHNTPRHGRVLMAAGRDAADVALSTVFGRAPLSHFYVISDEVDPPAEWVDTVLHRAPFPGLALVA